MKRFTWTWMGTLLLLCLTACTCTHQWDSLICTDDATCQRCGEVREGVEHQWTEATCDKGKTCHMCGYVGGQPLGHQKQTALIKAATPLEKGLREIICTRCGRLMGTEEFRMSAQDYAALFSGSYTVDQLLDELDSNAYRAEQTFQDKYIRLTGEIKTIDSDGSYFSLGPLDEYSFYDIHCSFTSEQQRQAFQFRNQGEVMTIYCQVVDIGEILGYKVKVLDEPSTGADPTGTADGGQSSPDSWGRIQGSDYSIAIPPWWDGNYVAWEEGYNGGSLVQFYEKSNYDMFGPEYGFLFAIYMLPSDSWEIEDMMEWCKYLDTVKMADGKWYELFLFTPYDVVTMDGYHEPYSMMSRDIYDIVDTLTPLEGNQTHTVSTTATSTGFDKDLDFAQTAASLTFISTDSGAAGQSIYQNDMTDADPCAYTVLDLDGDGENELIVEYDFWGDRLILHRMGDTYYGYIMAYRGMADLKQDGSYSGSSGADDSGIYRVETFSETGIIEVEMQESFESFWDKADAKWYAIS